MKIKKCFYIVIILKLLIASSACFRAREKEYYSNQNNYIEDTATIKNIIYVKEDNKIYLWLSNYNDAFQDSTFIIKGDSTNVVLQNQILSKLKIGDEIVYTSAPEYFGDGYCMPIVAISANGESLLDFNEGYKNLNELY